MTASRGEGIPPTLLFTDTPQALKRLTTFMISKYVMDESIDLFIFRILLESYIKKGI